MSTAPVSFSGLASGMDWQSIIDQLIKIDQVPQDNLKAEQTTNNTKLSALNTLSTQVGDLQTSINNLNDPSLYTKRNTTLSNTASGWSATAADGTTAGNYTFNVSQLATATTRTGSTDVGAPLSSSSNVSGLLVSDMRLTTPVTDGTFHVNGQAVSVASTDTLQDVFNKINTATGGQVTASYDATNDVIKLSSSSAITLGGGNDTSNFLYATKLYNNGSTSVTSSSKLGVVELTKPIASSGLAKAITNVDASGNGTFSINGTQISFNVNNDSVDSLMARINSSGAGVNISYDAVNDKFSLQNTATGNKGLVVSETSGGVLDAMGLNSTATETTGTNAVFTLNNGGTIVSSSNTLDSSVTGVTGLSVTAGATGTQTVTVGSDQTALKSAISDFITKYNNLQTYIDKQTAITSNSDGTVTSATLASDHEVTDLARGLRSRVFDAVPGLSGTVTRLESLGIDFSGTSSQLSVKDPAALDSALKNNLSDVQTLFTDSSNGLVTQLNSYIDNFNNNIYKAQTDSLNSQNQDLQTQIDGMTRQLAQEKDRLTQAFIAMEDAQSNMKTQSQYLSQIGTSSSGG